MLPEGWESKKLGSISSLVTSGSRDWAQFYSDTGSKFIRMTNLRRDSIYLKMDDLKFVDVNSDSADGKRTSLQTGDILISITAELGKIGWIHFGLGQAFINQHTALVRVKPKDAESKFIAYLLCSGAYHRRINSLNDAGAKAGLNLATIRTLDITLPPLHEQKKIAQILSTWDNAILAIERLLDNSQQRKKALMQQLLTGKKRLLGFEEEWKSGTLAEIANIDSGYAFKSSDFTDSEEGIPIVKMSDFKEGRLDLSQAAKVSTNYLSNIDKFKLQVGDFVFGMSGSLSNYAWVKVENLPCYLNQRVGRIVSKKNANHLFVTYLYLSDKVQQSILDKAAGAAQLNISVTDLRKLPVKYPSKIEQQAIANILTTADQEIDALQKRLEHLKLEKKALMQQLLTGKRRVVADVDAA